MTPGVSGMITTRRTVWTSFRIGSRPAAFGPPHLVYLDLARGSCVKPETGDLTLTGSLIKDETRHPMDPELLRSEVGFEEAALALERTSRAWSRLSDWENQHGYAGAFDITPDWMPILDESPLGGFYIAAGLSGHGFKLAPGRAPCHGRDLEAEARGRRTREDRRG